MQRWKLREQNTSLYSGMVYFTSSLSVRRLAGNTLLEQSNKESFTPAGCKIGISLLMEASHWVPFSYNHKEGPCSFMPVVLKWSIFSLEIMSHWDFSICKPDRGSEINKPAAEICWRTKAVSSAKTGSKDTTTRIRATVEERRLIPPP